MIIAETVAHTQWTGESIAAVIVAPLITIGLLVGAYFLRRRAKREDRGKQFDDYWWFQALSIALLVGVFFAVAGFVWGMYPWKAEYHQWRPVSGVVASVDSRLLAGDQASYQKYVVAFTGSPQQYGVLDTRAAGLKVGDHLTITCVRRWQYAGTDGFDCNFVDLERA